MSTWLIFKYVVIGVVLVIFGILLLNLLVSITNALDSITNKNKSHAKLYDSRVKDIENSLTNPDYNIRMRYSEDTLNMIIACIEIKVSNKLRTISALKTEYKLLDLDVDIKEIGDSVFNSFKKDFFNNDVILFSEDYIMSFIAENTARILLDNVISYNEDFHTFQREYGTPIE